MRENCQSGSMSGNGRQDQEPNRTEVTRRKPSQLTTGRLQSLRLFSTLLAALASVPVAPRSGSGVGARFMPLSSMKTIVRRSFWAFF